MTVYFFLYQRFPNFKDEFSANILFAATFIFIYFHFTYFLHIELRWGENCDWTKSIWLALIGQIPPGHCEVRGIISSGKEIHSDF